MLAGRIWSRAALLFSTALFVACATASPEGTSTSSGSGGSGGVAGGTDATGGGDAGPTPVCGDGTVSEGEDCDDGNTSDGDGCSSRCESEMGWACKSAPSVCAPVCGDGLSVGGEACDDGNTKDDDGCSSACVVEYGYTCSGQPSACSKACGDGKLVPGEECDDGNANDGDGCSATCKVEPGFECLGVPSACASICGDGVLGFDEQCDDANKAGGDGCSADCKVEPHFSCDGAPSVCTTGCGDGLVVGSEQCDDGNDVSGDGCSPSCKIEPGWACTGEPSACVASCGDGILSAGEDCDDGNKSNGDGCSATCKVELGFHCFGQPSFCLATCGDGVVASTEQCDDGNTSNADGCSSMCKTEQGYTCTGAPSTCKTQCGDGIVGGAEECDDGNVASGDGCSATCHKEPGFACFGDKPTVCTAICGDGLVVGNEQCDDGNTVNGDCCSSACKAEPGCEIEANDATTNANDFAALAIGGVVRGWINPQADLDVYRITVPSTPGANGQLTATTLDALGFTCASNLLDSYLTLYDGNGFPIIGSDGGGTGKCASISAASLGPGDYFVEVREGSTVQPFGYALKVDLTVVVCGDGVIGNGEQCDDGNNVSGDGCDSTCHLEKKPEVEPNNTCATANGPYELYGNPILLSGSISPSGDVDFFAFTLLNYADLVLETFDASGPGSCALIDTEMTLYPPSSCTTGLITKDQGGISNCTRLDPTADPVMRHLPPGTYYAKVFPYSSTATFNYTLQASLTALCGNGIVEGSEQCDGGPTCGADCTLLPVCGNGLKQSGEQCDDGNLVSGDGCDATCHWETTAEVEPNNTIAAAAANATSNPKLLLNGSRNLTGAIGTSGDKDVFQVSVASQSAVRFEIFDATGTDCTGMTTMTLQLLDSSGTQLKTDSPDTAASGIGVCPALLVNLAPGTYYLQAQASSGTVPAYFLQVKFETSLGSEVEPNDTRSSATPLSGTDMYVFGGHQTGSDVDVYAVTVQAGASIRAEVIEGDSSKTCESLGIDSYLTLYDANGTSKATDDDDGRGYCSAIDGTGSSPRDSGAHALAAGTYYIEVKASSLASTAAAQFNYLLMVTIRNP